MKVFLMHQDHDVHRGNGPLPGDDHLSRDLDLRRILAAMAGEDGFLLKVARETLLSPLQSVADIRFRHQVLADCLLNPGVVRDLYDLSVEVVEAEKKIYHSLFSDYPDAVLHRSLESLELLLGLMHRLLHTARADAARFSSPGFIRFFEMVEKDMDDEYLDQVAVHLKRLKFPHGFTFSARLGRGNKGIGHVLRTPNPDSRNWFERLIRRQEAGTLSFAISDRDEAGFRALGDLKNIGINMAANALAQSDDHIVSFFAVLRSELAFYIGCLNLYEVLESRGQPVSFPAPQEPGSLELRFRSLRDMSLALAGTGETIGNDLDAHGKDLLVVTGANEGGKSTFLRSLGTAQVMMQAGMFVCAESLSTGICSATYTHFKREEDQALESGKLDEELRRMSAIADVIKTPALVLFNESFSATNEREGTLIARNIIDALRATGMRVVFVTHFFELASGLHAEDDDGGLFLRAERLEDGSRTHRIIRGDPQPTSYGRDLYREIFGVY